MKILVLANNDIGLYRFRKELIYELLKDNEVFISLPYGELVTPLIEAGCTFIETNVDRRGMNPIKDYKLYKSYKKIVSEIRPDLVITYTIKPNIYGGVVCRNSRITYAENITGLGSAFEKRGFLRFLVTQLYKYSLKESRVVFFENHSDKQVFVDCGIVAENRVHVLNGAGVNLDEFSYLDYPCNSVFKFLFIGRVMKEKGIEELFHSMRKLAGNGYMCSLDVIGPCEENYIELIDLYQNEGWLKYHGYQKDVRPYIELCDCFVLPSYHEGMANTNLECAASGRPLITSNIPGCKEAVIEGVSGYLCEARSEESLYDAMIKMYKLSNAERKTMGIKAREHVENVFDKHKVVRATVEALFQEVTCEG